MEQVELLAPAKDFETGKAAIDCGADAVYIGSTRFGAREAAGNSLESIANLAEYAHQYWAKVYVTVNTLLFDHELPEAEQLIHQLYSIGIDALIIQDVGLLELDLPPLPIIASTQMHNHSAERIAFLEKIGFQRAILARELSLDEIRNIRSQTKIELECFIHGALCVSYSGQCAMSYALGGRSGNRGQCAQPCRRRYRLLDAERRIIQDWRYLLSLRDLNLSNHLSELIDAGVCSFKIEGRLKGIEYVKNIVGYYRLLLDEILAGRKMRPASSGKIYLDFTPDPNKTFNRGYTTYFLFGRKGSVASIKTPKSTGELIGKALQIKPTSITVETQSTLIPGDGICFFDKNGELQGTIINRVEGVTVFPERIEGFFPGATIFRNHDQAFTQLIKKARPERKIKVSFLLQETEDGFSLIAVDEDGNRATHSIQCKKEAAKKPEQAFEVLTNQIKRLGDTPFSCEIVDILLSTPYFLQFARINELRRGVINRLIKVRNCNRPIHLVRIVKNDAQFPEDRLSYLGNVANEKAAIFYKRHGVQEIDRAAETGLDLVGKKIMTTKHCVKFELGFCTKEKSSPKYQEPLYLEDEEGNTFPLHFRCNDCEMDIYYKRIT